MSHNLSIVPSIYQHNTIIQRQEIISALIYEVSAIEVRIKNLEKLFYFKTLPSLPIRLKATRFDFVSEVAKGNALLIGEGNLSFALSLVKTQSVVPRALTATTFEQAADLTLEAKENMEKLRQKGVLVLHDVDATKLATTFGNKLFDTIVFQFPHTGSREPVEGHNPNFILVRDFLKSAYTQLTSNGSVLISVVDSPHYNGAFQFESAAEIAEFQPPETYPFDPWSFSGYEHTMTHQNGSALDEHDIFNTWVFRKHRTA